MRQACQSSKTTTTYGCANSTAPAAALPSATAGGPSPAGIDNENGTQTWTFTRNGGTLLAGATISADSLALDYGISGNGFFEISAIDGLNGQNAPYWRIARWTGHPATGTVVRAQGGQLRGIFGQDEFGLFVGTGTADTDRYLRLSDYTDAGNPANSGNRINNLSLSIFNNGTETIHIGPWNNFWLGPDAGHKKFYWDGTKLTIEGEITVVGGNAATTDALTNGLAGKISTGGAAADVNANTTTISGGKITTGSITADKINVTTLSAIKANMGTLTAGSIVIGSTNKLWLNDASDGALNIGGATKASAPFRVTAAGALTATNATISGTVNIAGGSMLLDSEGAGLLAYSHPSQGYTPADDKRK